MLPKKIHQIWLGKKEDIPVKCQMYSKIIQQVHPDWEYHMWDSSILTEELINKYQLKDVHPAIQSDILRILIIKEHGGIYLDVDCKPMSALDPLLDCAFLASSESWSQRGMFIHGCFFGAIAGHPMLDYAIEKFNENAALDLPPEKKYGYPVFNDMVQSLTGPGVTILNPNLTKKYIDHNFMKSWTR